MANLHDRPPGRAAAPERASGAGDRSGWQARLAPYSTPGGMTGRYIRSRERVLGRRVWVHEDPAIAAGQLVERLGPLGAAQWLRRALEEVGRG